MTQYDTLYKRDTEPQWVCINHTDKITQLIVHINSYENNYDKTRRFYNVHKVRYQFFLGGYVAQLAKVVGSNPDDGEKLAVG